MHHTKNFLEFLSCSIWLISSILLVIMNAHD
jgi:hypothetical protein